MALVAVITGLATEARILRRAARGRTGVLLLCEGAGSARAEAAARRAVSEGAQALASFGIAGGLKPLLAPGTVIVAHAVVAPDGRRYDCHAGWHARLIERLLGEEAALDGVLCGSAEPVATAAGKAALLETTGGAAVDMESYAVAAVAADASLPFIALRAVADPAERNLPPAAIAALGQGGRVRMLPVIGGLARRPHHLPAMLRLAFEAGQARAALRRVVALAGPDLAGGRFAEKA